MYRKTSRSTAARLNTGLLFVAALIPIAIVGSSYREWTEYRSASAEATQTREIIDSVRNILSDAIDAEAGQRGFVLTGDTRYLEPYNRAILAIPTEEATLSKLLARSQGQSASARLSELTDQELANFTRQSTFERRRALRLH